MVSSPPPQGDHTHYLNLTDAVELGYGAYQTLRGWIKQGKLPAVKIGGRVKVLRSDLDALAAPTQPSHTFETVEAAVADRRNRSPTDRRAGPQAVGTVGRCVMNATAPGWTRHEIIDLADARLAHTRQATPAAQR